jgi:hypothetical protein
MIRFTAMLDSTRSRGILPLRFQAIAGSAAMLVAIPFTSLRLVPVAPKAPIAITSPNSPTRQLAAADSVMERTLAASNGERISIDLRTGGSVTIHGWSQPQVRLRAVLSGNQWRETRVMFDRTANGIELRAVVDSSGNNYVNSNSFELWVPRTFDVQTSSAGGAIAIDNVEGRFAGNTGGGEITLDNISGDASLTTGGGEVTVTNSSLNGSVTTGSGKALVTNTSGNLSVTSGSGPVIRDRVGQSSTRVYGVGGLASTTISGGSQPMIVVDGKLISGGGYSYNSAGGDIRLESVPNGGSFNTGGGAIVIGSVGGPASFSTGGGDVKISNVADDISVATGVGSVEISVISGNGTARNISVATTLGRVVIELPSNLDARFDIESAYTERHGPTRIDSDFTINVTETPDWDSGHGVPRRYVRGSGSVGSGRGPIKIRTMNGNVVIRRR